MANNKFLRTDWFVLVGMRGNKPPPLGRILVALLGIALLGEIAAVAAGLFLLRLALQMGMTPDQLGGLLGAVIKKLLPIP